ncbi:MAG: efflux RND transporter periplasmic adaptor subunit, partial [Verrucomicrobia bacterium]|nr:efflux RND transporter periplasmic adaptor subunit [Verrucomicrobiota bacterium]
IKIPRLQSFLSLRFALVVGALLLACAFVYWARNVRPYLSLSSAHINAYSTLLSSDMAARLVEIGPQEGDRVKKGAFLFAFDRNTSQYENKKASLEHLEQQITLEKEQMIEAMEGYLAATSDFELGIGDPHTVQTQLQLLEEAQRKSEEAQSKLAAVQKELDTAAVDLKKGAYCAPFDGVILKRYKNEGEVCAVGDRIFSLCDLDRLWVEVQVPEAHIGKITLGTPARVRLHAYPNKELMGKVSFIGSATAAKSNYLPWSQQGESVPIKITLDSKDSALKPGLSAQVDLKVR